MEPDRQGEDGAPATVPAPEFALAMTIDSGQVFHWRRSGGGFAGVVDETLVRVEQREDGTLLVPRGQEERVARYFALDHPLPEIYASFPADPAMNEALTHCQGLRVIRQEPWECLATFITSALKQVAHIAQISHRLRGRFGRLVGQVGEVEYHAYPTVEAMAALDELTLRACGLGFRAKSLLATARLLAEGKRDLESIRALDDQAALAELCRFPGVGAKVANCVLLFGYERLRAFPIDVWIERVLREMYFQRKPEVTTAKLQRFSEKYFGAYGGYAQQYLFHHARKIKARKAGGARKG